MFHSTSLVSFLAFLSVVSPNSTVIHRRKRYLAFPPKANFVLTLALLKGIPYDIKPSPTTKIITTYECDVLFPLPRVPDPFRFSTESATRHRRQLHSQIEELLDMNGHDGRACVQAAICKMREIRLSNVENLLENFLMILFGSTREDQSDKACSQPMLDSCSISLIDIVLQWAEHVFIELGKQINGQS